MGTGAVVYEVRIANEGGVSFSSDGQARAYAAAIVRERPELDFVTIIAWVNGKPGQRWIVRRTCKTCGRIIGKGKCVACEGV